MKHISEKNEYINWYNMLLEEITELEDGICEEMPAGFPSENVRSCFVTINETAARCSLLMDKLIVANSKRKFTKISGELDELLDALDDRRIDLINHRSRIRAWKKDKAQEERFRRFSEKYDENLPVFSGYFAGCTTKRKLTKRYRALAKQFHPDNGGDGAVFLTIQKEYKERFSNPPLK